MPDPTNSTVLEERVAKLFEELRARSMTDKEIYAAAAQDLKQLARQMTARQPAGASLNATRLFNEVWIKLFEIPRSDFHWENGQDFFLAVARAMHNFKVDYIRRKMAAKRGGGMVGSLDELQKLGFEPPAEPFEAQAMKSFAVDQALRKLREEFPDREKAIVLTYWGDDTNPDGLTQTQVAEILKVSPDKIKYDLRAGRARMKHYLST
jgi:RNA polymerase sigma factor (TIGR02999 family)